MSSALAALRRTQGEICALLMAGMTTQRGGRDALIGLADELSALKLERLAAQVRRLAEENDPTAVASLALTTLAMARKLSERLLPWPEVDVARCQPLQVELALTAPHGAPSASADDVSALAHSIQTGSSFERARASEGIVSIGPAAVPELARLASNGTVAVRREAIGALARIGGADALGVVLGRVGDVDCWRALHLAIAPRRQEAIGQLAALISADKGAKQDGDRIRMAAVLLYRLGALRELSGLSSHDDPAVTGLVVAARAILRGDLSRIASQVDRAKAPGLTVGALALAHAEASGDEASLVDQLDELPIPEVREAGRWLIGGPLEAAVRDACLARLKGGNAHSRQKAANALAGISEPGTVLPLAAMLQAGEVEAGLATTVLGQVGGGYACGVLLDIASKGLDSSKTSAWLSGTSGAPDLRYLSSVVPGLGGVSDALQALRHLGDPDTVGPLIALLRSASEMLSESPHHPLAPAIESALAGIEDSAVDHVAAEIEANEGTPLAARLANVLFQMKTRRATEALRSTSADTVDSMLDRLGHKKLGAAAVQGLSRHGDAVLEKLAGRLHHQSHAVQMDAANAIGAIGTSRAYEIMEGLLENVLPSRRGTSDGYLGAKAVELIARRRQMGDAPLFIRQCVSGHTVAAEAALKALVGLGPEVVPLVFPLLNEPSARARRTGLQVLGKLKVAEVAPRATELLADSDPFTRADAADALASVVDSNGSAQLVHAMGAAAEAETNELVRNRMVVSLGQTTHRDAAPHLRECATKMTVGFYHDLAIRLAEEIEAANATGQRSRILDRVRRVLGGS